MAELKPCPACGVIPCEPSLCGHKWFINGRFEEDWAINHFCQNISVTAYGKSAEEAIEAWNRRAGE